MRIILIFSYINQIMNKMSSNSIDPKKKIFGIENASPTFQKIITKYRNNRNSNLEDAQNIMSIVEKAKYKLENMETEEDYLMKELRNDRKFMRKLIFLYGQRAGNHYNEIRSYNEFKSKVDKNYFFSPKEIQTIKTRKKKIKTEKNSIPLLPNFFYNKKKSSNKFLKIKPTIDKEKKTSYLSKNSTGMSRFYNTTSNIKIINNNKGKNNNNQKNLTEFSQRNIPNNIEDEYLNINRKPDAIRDKIIFLKLKKNSLFKNKTNNEFHLSKKLYLDNLIKINSDFTKTKNEFRKHFVTNDYGCNYSKQQYEYLTKKYFKY